MNLDECVICFETIGKTNMCVTPCGHGFCFECIMKHSKQNENCPVCRQQITQHDNADIFGGDDDDEDDADDDLSNEYLLGHVDENGVYYFPSNIETLDEMVQVFTEIGYPAYATDIYYAFLKICDPDYSWENHVGERLVADNFTELMKKTVDIFKRTQMLKRHIIQKHNIAV
jgi:hypothetical protein